MNKSYDKYEAINVTKNDTEIQKVLKHQQQEIDNTAVVNERITLGIKSPIKTSEELLRSLGKSLPKQKISCNTNVKREINIRSWTEIADEAEVAIRENVKMTDLLSERDIIEVEQKIKCLQDEFDRKHRLDFLDYGIAGVSGILAALVDIFLVKIPSRGGLLGGSGVEGGSISDFFRDHFKNKFTPKQIRELEVNNRVPYDAATSQFLNENVTGLGPRSHRIQSLGHDPVLGFIFGVKDIMCGSMTAIDAQGKLIIQQIPNAPSGINIFEALTKQIGHLSSDIGTPAGLPSPFIPLLQMVQVGSFGKRGRTIGELTRTMYGQGYDFGHFLAMSVPVLLIEVLVRTFYFLKRIYEGYDVIESIPFDIPGQPRKPKLQTMLFMAHAIATGVNAGKLMVTNNPLSINFPQWIWFGKSAIQQLRWVSIVKENERLLHVQKSLDLDWEHVNDALLAEWAIIESKNK